MGSSERWERPRQIYHVGLFALQVSQYVGLSLWGEPVSDQYQFSGSSSLLAQCRWGTVDVESHHEHPFTPLYGMTFKVVDCKANLCVKAFISIIAKKKASANANAFLPFYFFTFLQFLKTSPSPNSSMMIGLSRSTSSARSFFDRSLSTNCWMARFTGRAPKSGS